ncbi:MAG TPA: tetratricopeptide repeat protein, partial [Pyrinomonadaceae bacterium]|nr:tetratricopeptide repeat protein [Pyrinomonadaceae bacterium]
MFVPLAQYVFAGLLALASGTSCVTVETPPAPPVSNEAGAVFFESLPAADQGDDALVSTRRLDRAGRLPDGQLAQLTPQEHMRRAAAYLANRAFAEAREHWQTLVARYPTDANVPAALFGMGRSLYQERRYSDALPFFDRLGREFAGQKEGREGYYYVAATLLRLDRAADAATRYGDYVARFPQGERVENAHLNAIDSWREAGRNDQAIQWIARTRERYRGTPSDANALFAHLRLDIASGDWQSALTAADELRKANFTPAVQTTQSEVAYLRAFALERLKQTAQAAAVYQSVPDRAASYYGELATARLQTLDAASKRAATTRAASVRTEIDAAAG